MPNSSRRTNRPFLTLRSSLLLRFGILLASAVALFALGYVYFGVRPVVTRIAAGHFAVAAEQVEGALDRIFHPAEDLVQAASQWGVAPGFPADSPRVFNQLFQPLLQQIPHITSVVAGTSDGRGWLLLQLPERRWRNRLTDIPSRGDVQHFIDWQEGSPPQESRQTMDYDPRDRPWYKGAVGSAGGVYWTEPYTFYTTRDPGITVSSNRSLPDGRTIVVGLDIMLLDISRATAGVRVGEHGHVAVFTSDERILGLPRSGSGIDDGLIRQKVLRPAAELGNSPVTAGLTQWRQEGRPTAAILHFAANGKPWLGSLRPYHLGGQTLWVAVFAPEADFTPGWRPLAQGLAVILCVVLGLTFVVAKRQAIRFSTPLEALAAASERIAQLDFEPGSPVRTNLVEMDKLASTLDAMRVMLSNFRETVQAQEEKLNSQIESLHATQSQLRESEAHLQEALVQQQAILDNALVGIVFVRKRTFIHCNRIFAELLGYTVEDLVGKSAGIMYDTPETFTSLGDRAYEIIDRGGNFVEELWLRRKDGSRFWGHLSGRAVNEVNGVDEGTVWILLDLTERRKAQEQLEYLGHHDPLTDLPNRLLFTDRLSHAILRASRRCERMALLFIDLDHFKTVNDTMGHDVGDQLLCAVARNLSRRLRVSDTLARLGGDEFVVLVEGVDGAGSVGSLASTLIDAFSAPLDVGPRQFYITGSIGISLYPADGTDAATLVRNADAAMYQAKQAGRNTFHFYSEDMTRKAVARLELEHRLRHAVEHGDLEVHFQPQVSLADGSITGAEALLRLRHPERGLVPPLEFIPLAEETGLIHTIGLWVLEQSCREWLALRKNGIHLPRIAVNLSPKQLQRRNFLTAVTEVLERTGIPRGVLELEITESLFLETDGAAEVMRALGTVGVMLSLDDFGTGYSSLSYLKRLPLGKLKIDRGFVREIGTDSDGEALVRTIITLAATLGLTVVAEGVETQTQVDFLHREGCPEAQGFFFGAPMPAGEFREWMARRAGRA